MKKKLLKIFSYLVIAPTILFFSCEKDDFNNNIDNHSHKQENVISFKEFLEKTKIKNFKLGISTNHNQSLTHNRQASDFSGFIVDTTLVKQRIQSSGNYTFTLPVIPIPHQNSENIFYNIVFYKANNNWLWSVLEYEKKIDNENEYNVKEIVNDFNHNGLVNMRLQGVWNTTITFNCVGCVGACDLCPLCVTTTTTYELTILDDPTSKFEIIADYGNNNDGGGSFSNTAYLNPFINSLSQNELTIYYENPSIQEYLLANIVVAPNPNYNPLLGGSETIVIINPEAENYAKNLIDLYIEIDINPNLLLDIPCSQIAKWQALAQHNLPISTITKIDNLQTQNNGAVPNWDIQFLGGAEGAVVNMDFFPVTISQFPTNPNTNQPYTPQEFYNFFRRNLNQFTTGTGVTFFPSTITGIDESVIWNSNNPLNAVISINIGIDNGSVICSQYTSNHWYFTTLTTPWAFSWTEDDYDGFHPVSGNREFGYYNDLNGNYVFYVRGVDRIQRSSISAIADILNPENPFEDADQLWNKMQQNLKNFVNNNGGSATVNADQIYRPNWNDVKDVLRGVKPISDLGCN